MAKAPTSRSDANPEGRGYDSMLIVAMEGGDVGLETGRFILTYDQGSTSETKQAFESLSVRTVDARELGPPGSSEIW